MMGASREATAGATGSGKEIGQTTLRGMSRRSDAERSLAASEGTGRAPVSTGLNGTGFAPRLARMWRMATATDVLPTAVSVPRMKMPLEYCGRGGERGRREEKVV